MYIVAIAWLFIMLTLSLGASTVLGGTALFFGAGLAPVALAGWLLARGRRSMGQQRMHDADQTDTRRDQ